MAHTASAKKRIRQSLKRKQRNSYIKTTLRTFNKKFEKAVVAGDQEVVKEMLVTCQKKLAKAASKGVIPKSTASRKTSRLAQAAKKLALASAAQA
ncbi:30S ribosomal protein S20 [Chrysiogenes arsenatis]|uniref:30S ribosomal protein S20 n=1 Tax=Chrysiogenes arsenatis TaxID=309797 RepID=UPI000425E65F|nr:30S ribosomal protein S20 [Chrysiogenes arsenatis]